MFTGTYLCTPNQRASLLDEIVLESSTSVRTRDIQSITTKCISEMPCHVSKLDRGLLSEFEGFRTIRRKI